MAYLSRGFGPVGDDEQRRLASGDPLAAGAAAPSAGAGGLAQAPAPGSPDTASIDHNAIRSFFAANQNQGANVLGGLADSLSQRISATPSQMPTIPAITPIIPYHYSTHPAQNPAGGPARGQEIADASVKANADSIEVAKAAAAKNVAGLSPLKTDVGQLGNMEGQQNLLSQQHAGQNYTPGQSRLDSWLSGAATSQSPATLNNVNSGMQALTDNTGIYDPATQKKKNVEDYLHGI